MPAQSEHILQLFFGKEEGGEEGGRSTVFQHSKKVLGFHL